MGKCEPEATINLAASLGVFGGSQHFKFERLNIFHPVDHATSDFEESGAFAHPAPALERTVAVFQRAASSIWLRCLTDIFVSFRTSRFDCDRT